MDIRGTEIHDFLADLFKERFTRHNISLVQTDAFARMRITGFPSSFYPVFVNLVDNAIYWLSQQNPAGERLIKLDAAGDAFLISDSGTGIDTKDCESIFQLGFTRKPGGRGMGLYISREALRRVGYDLALEDDRGAKGATFSIRPIISDTERGNSSE